MERNLAMELVRVTEAAALGSARLMGRGDETAADMAAVEAMRDATGVLPIDGTVVIGGGDHDAMPMLCVSERVGTGQGPELDVACDALEGAAICATGGYNALSVIAIADRGSLLRVPDSYMDKIACGPEGRGIVDLDRSPTENLRALADAKGVYVEDLTVVILDRPRHTRLIEEVRRRHELGRHAVFDPYGADHRGAPPLRSQAGVLRWPARISPTSSSCGPTRSSPSRSTGPRR